MTDTRFSRDNLPADGWVEYRKTQTTPMVRVDGPFTVVTREGPLHCEDGYLACPADGWPYPVAVDYHDANYEPAAALPTPPAEAELSRFSIVTDDGHPELHYFPDGEEEVGEFVSFVDSGDVLGDLTGKARRFITRREATDG